LQLTHKFQIYPTLDQEKVLWTLSEQCRLLYNTALAERKNEWEINRKSVNYIKQQNDLPYRKQKYNCYSWVNSKVLQMVLRTLDANYKSFFKLVKEDPASRSPMFKGRYYFFTMKYNQSGFKFENNTITLSHNIPDEHTCLQFPVPETFTFTKVKQVDVFLDKIDHKWYLSIVDEIQSPLYKDNGMYQAWDLGITKQTGVNLQGKFIEVKNIRPDLYWNKSISILQSKRDHCKKNSTGRKYYNNLKRKCERKCRNQIKDFQHKTSLMIVQNTKANTIVVGDLGVKRMAHSKNSSKKLNKSTQGTGYLNRFTEFLTYKAEKVGKKVIKISEHYSTQECCSCGKRHKMTLSDRVMKCDCGNILDRDRNSSVNIMSKFLSQNALWIGYEQFVHNLRNTGLNLCSVYSQETPSVRVG
jgi:putative transposase